MVLLIHIPNMFHHALTQGLEVIGDVSVGGNSWNNDFERVKEERDCLLDEVGAYKMEKKKHEKTMLEKEVEMEAMTWSVMDSERPMNRLETEKSLLEKPNEEITSC